MSEFTKLKGDPIYENECLAAQGEKYKPDSIRFTKTKAVLKKYRWSDEEGNDTFEIKKGKNKTEIMICTWQHRAESRSVLCNQGHHHPVLKVEKIWLERIEITNKEAEQLGNWLLGREDHE